MSHELKLERLFDAWPEAVFGEFTGLQAQKGLYADAPDWIVEAECDLRVGGRRTIVPGAFPAAGVRDEFAEGRASILAGLGRAVAARVTDRS